MMFQTNISKEQLNALPRAFYTGRKTVVDDPAKLPGICREIRKHQVLGFDTETRPAFRKGRKNKIALLQLASRDQVWLFRLNRVGLPAELTGILSDEHILKIGVAIRDDIRGLQVYNRFRPGGFIDLSTYSDAFLIRDNGLRKLAGIILGERISKAQQLSNWENEQLTEQQVQYASVDAWACLRIYQTLQNHPIER